MSKFRWILRLSWRPKGRRTLDVDVWALCLTRQFAYLVPQVCGKIFDENFPSRGLKKIICCVWYFLPHKANFSSCADDVSILLSQIRNVANKIAFFCVIFVSFDWENGQLTKWRELIKKVSLAVLLLLRRRRRQNKWGRKKIWARLLIKHKINNFM